MSERDGARTIGRSGEKAGQKTRDTFPLRQSKETSQFPTVDEARLRKREQCSNAVWRDIERQSCSTSRLKTISKAALEFSSNMFGVTE